MDSLEEMEKFLKTTYQNNDADMEHLNRPTSMEIKSRIKNFSLNKIPRTEASLVSFAKYSKKELKPILLKLCQKVEEERPLPSNFYEPSIILISDKDAIDEHRCKNIQNTSQENSTIH